ncbi:Aluminum-activated malate transporter 10 [Forsythia ovata]|uniref:Aluminum-activated malate transporter 10 n=1 Tax=Forsythia ovata TaxID=205694 RepID=A0ABD1WMX7_9LAMI
MTNLNESSTGQLEWSIRLPEGSSQNLVSETSPAVRFWLFIKCLMVRILEKVWNMGTDDHRKVIHCIKVGISLSVVSLFYYIRPLYDGVGGNAMWAVLTVVVVFEYTVG